MNETGQRRMTTKNDDENEMQMSKEWSGIAAREETGMNETKQEQTRLRKWNADTNVERKRKETSTETETTNTRGNREWEH